METAVSNATNATRRYIILLSYLPKDKRKKSDNIVQKMKSFFIWYVRDYHLNEIKRDKDGRGWFVCLARK